MKDDMTKREVQNDHTAKREKLLEVMGQIDDTLIYDAVNDGKCSKTQKNERRRSWLHWGVAAACLCLLMIAAGIFTPAGGPVVTAYAYGTEEEITAAGVIMSTGTIGDDGEMTGHPLMFFLAGEDIATVRFSCKNQMINFIDWTEKRDEFGNAQNFTVTYGEDENEYYFLLIDWVPVDTIRELTSREDATIPSLPQELREDVIVMEITFADGSEMVKAIHVSLQDDGTFFATFDDYRITEEDIFILRPDSEAIPRDILYGETELAVTFYDAEGREVEQDALWYNLYWVEEILVHWTGTSPDTVRAYYTPSGTEMADQLELLQTKMVLDGDGQTTFSMAEWERSDWHGDLQIELDYGDSKVVSDLYNVFLDPEIPRFPAEAEMEGVAGEEPEMEDPVDVIFATARAYYEGTVFEVEGMALLEYSFSEARLEVQVSKGGEIQEALRTMTLESRDGVWEVINEGY